MALWMAVAIRVAGYEWLVRWARMAVTFQQTLMNRHFLMDLVDCWYLQGRALKVEDEFRRGVYLHAVE